MSCEDIKRWRGSARSPAKHCKTAPRGICWTSLETDVKRPMDQTKLLRNEQGVTSIEYALLGALIAMVIITSVAALGSNVHSLYQMIAAAVP